MAVSTSSIDRGRLLHLNQRPLSIRAVPPSSVSYRPAASTSRTHTPTISCSSAAASSAELSDVTPSGSRAPDRTTVRLGLPSKGRMAEETLNLLKTCQLSVRQVNPRQYVADIPQIASLEVWYQRPKDIVRKLRSGDLDLGIVGFDTLSEYGEGPTISPVFHDYKHEGRISVDYYAIVICVPRKALYKSVQQLRSVGGSGVLVSPLTYIFEEETPRWRSLLLQLGL